MTDWLFWLLICLFLLVFEFVTPGNLICVWFAISSLCAALVAYLLPIAIYLQILIFVVGGFVAMFILRRIYANSLKSFFVPTNTDMLLGKKFVLKEDVRDGEQFRIDIHGVNWTFVLRGHDKKAGEAVCVKAIEGNRIIVE